MAGMKLKITEAVISLDYEMFFFSIRTLAQFLTKQKSKTKLLSEKELLRMFSQMVDALLYLHGHKILHRYVIVS